MSDKRIAEIKERLEAGLPTRAEDMRYVLGKLVLQWGGTGTTSGMLDFRGNGFWQYIDGQYVRISP